MRLSSWLTLAAAVACDAPIDGASVPPAALCSSLSGPFCTGVSSDFVTPPPHATALLDRDEQRIREDDLNKRLKVEHVLKQFELEAAKQQSARSSDDDDVDERLLEELNELLDETVALLAELQGDEGAESPVVGSFAFSSEGDTYDLLETMDGKEMQDFFVLAYDEVLRAWESTLEDMSPEISQGLRQSVEQLRGLEDYEAYEFQYIDDPTMDNMRQRFKNHRLMEVQRTFEKLIVAKNAHERHVAFESVVYLFQLAQEEEEMLQEELQQEEEEAAQAKADAAASRDDAHT